ncbi:MAG TPA: class I SAM-dependent methyltransferase [Burkholderiales bacterium]|nr:class I SAM-dependent methyltransferase [Burkholderiales bacterium]
MVEQFSGSVDAGSRDVLIFPSDWVKRWASYIPRKAKVLDLACGSGRHSRYLARLGHEVTAVDLDISRISSAVIQNVIPLKLDIEHELWPFALNEFSGIVVTNYLYRPVFSNLIKSLAIGGVLIYETFSHGNEQYGNPKRPEYLLLPGELLEIVEGKLHVLGYEDGYVNKPRPACVQRICARKEN